MREIFSNTKFHYIVPESDKDKEFLKKMDLPTWIKCTNYPIVENAGETPKNVYFITSGAIHLMDNNGLYDYGILREGCCFGDVSLLLEEPEEFSYFYDPYHSKPILMLEVPSKKFLEICERYPLAKEVMKMRA
jgi:signal-transduction protein with cAMP-binding, CBS, and nucleotidyltransferase domain